MKTSSLLQDEAVAAKTGPSPAKNEAQTLPRAEAFYGRTVQALISDQQGSRPFQSNFAIVAVKLAQAQNETAD